MFMLFFKGVVTLGIHLGIAWMIARGGRSVKSRGSLLAICTAFLFPAIMVAGERLVTGVPNHDVPFILGAVLGTCSIPLGIDWCHKKHGLRW